MPNLSLSTMLTSMLHAAAGRIHWKTGMWALIDGEWDRRRVTSAHPRAVNGNWFKADDTTRPAGVLVRRSCVTNCPKPPAEGFFTLNNKSWVPETECRKCPNFQGSTKQYRFVRCLARSVNNPAFVVRERVNEAVEKAVQYIG